MSSDHCPPEILSSPLTVYLWAPRARPTKSSYCMVAVPFMAVSRVLKLSVSRLIWTVTTMKLSRVNLRSRGLYFDNRFCANVGVNLEEHLIFEPVDVEFVYLCYLYPMLPRAAVKSSWERVPSLSLSKFSNILFQSLM